MNIETFIIKAKKNKLIKKNMADARINRFDGLLNFCNKNNILHLFLGHHCDDKGYKLHVFAIKIPMYFQIITFIQSFPIT